MQKVNSVYKDEQNESKVGNKILGGNNKVGYFVKSWRRRRDLIMLTRRWALSSMKSSCIWPKSAALPCEYKKVNLANGCFHKVATILLPPFVSKTWTSMLLSVQVSPENTTFPSSPFETLYVGGSGGKNANFAATVPVTFPIQ